MKERRIFVDLDFFEKLESYLEPGEIYTPMDKSNGIVVYTPDQKRIVFITESLDGV